MLCLIHLLGHTFEVGGGGAVVEGSCARNSLCGTQVRVTESQKLRNLGQAELPKEHCTSFSQLSQKQKVNRHRKAPPAVVLPQRSPSPSLETCTKHPIFWGIASVIWCRSGGWQKVLHKCARNDPPPPSPRFPKNDKPRTSYVTKAQDTRQDNYPCSPRARSFRYWWDKPPSRLPCTPRRS